MTHNTYLIPDQRQKNLYANIGVARESTILGKAYKVNALAVGFFQSIEFVLNDHMG
jgi:hypothetical protein